MATADIADPAALDLDLQPEHRLVYVDGEPLDLTYLEFELLAHLLAHPLRVHTRTQLMHVVWGWSAPQSSRTVDTHVARVRSKLGRHRDRIETVHRVGYRFRPASSGQRTGSAA